MPLKQAVANAIEFAEEALENRARDVQLEEVESVDNHGASVWLITLSMLPPVPAESVFSVPMALQRRLRDYKTFTVLKDTGEVTAMKIREFAGE